MYRKYFGFKKLPFSIAPDPRYLYMSEQHREALAHLLYGIKNDCGFVMLTGEVGTGKTTICRRLLEQIPKSCSVAFIINPRLSAEELLAAICDEFGIEYPKRKTGIKVFVDLLNAYLLEAHAHRRRALLIIDEAQNLSNEVLEQIRLLTNLETNERKLLQIILLGQPELRTKLARPELRQLAQRIVARYHLGPLSKGEVSRYVNHRLLVAGGKYELFSSSSLRKLYSLSGGIPRIINAICDRSLLGASVQGKFHVDRATLVKASREVLGDPFFDQNSYKRIAIWVVAAILLMSAGVFGTMIYQRTRADVAANTPPAVTEAEKTESPGPIPESGSQGASDQAKGTSKDTETPSAQPGEKSTEEGGSETPAKQPGA
jgi:general secretion pathway protein A